MGSVSRREEEDTAPLARPITFLEKQAKLQSQGLPIATAKVEQAMAGLKQLSGETVHTAMQAAQLASEHAKAMAVINNIR